MLSRAFRSQLVQMIARPPQTLGEATELAGMISPREYQAMESDARDSRDADMIGGGGGNFDGAGTGGQD